MAIIVQISSGLGNQMFQYASAYAVAKKNKQKLILDPNFIFDERKYQLQDFSLDVTRELLTSQLTQRKITNGHVLKLVNALKKASIRHYPIYSEKKQFEYDEQLMNINSPMYLQGYWQSWKYFAEVRDDIRRQFTYRKQLSKRAEDFVKSVSQENSVALHIRRTDYKTILNGACLSMDYYSQAIKRIQEKEKDCKFYLFTDEKESADLSQLPLETQIVDGVTDEEEFVIMQKCRHHIIANSTFSWWAAYLAGEGTVIAPVVGMWRRDFYLNEWHTINTYFE